ncbi:hypothetical protein T484DRAFT_1982130 [Baffinella frigidus]|nr:hypothetical protein T484DRAFT_1982130 [Cryptophyta sp. CCMP2293]
MVSLGWGRGFALLLSVLAVQHSSAALYGEACSSDKDCTTSVEVVGRPSAFCSMMFVDRTPLNDAVNPSKPVVTYGKCVECVEDCDCGVGQRCGIPILQADQVTIQGTAAPFTSLSSSLPAWLKKRVQNLATAVNGFPINSKCLEYTYNEEGATPGHCTPVNTHNRGYSESESWWKIVKEVPTKSDGTEEDPLNVVRMPNFFQSGIPKAVVKPDAGEARWCGEVNVFHGIGQDAFAPAFQSVVDLRASNRPDYTSKNNMARYSTGDLYDTAAICPKVVEADVEKCDQCRGDCGSRDAMPNDELSFFDDSRFTLIIAKDKDLSEACGVYDRSTTSARAGGVFPDGRIGSSGTSGSYTAKSEECKSCMGKCPGTTKYIESDAQKTCIANCLLPYATCIIDVKVGVSGLGPFGWADAERTTRPVGYSSADTDTKLDCSSVVSVETAAVYNNNGNSNPMNGFFQLQPARTDDNGGNFKWSRLMPTRTNIAFTMSMRTVAVAWEGTCRLGTCNVCAEGTQRCTPNPYLGRSPGRGISQICQNGRWVESRTGMVVQEVDEPFGWNEDLIVQTALTVIAGVIMVLLCALTAMGCVKQMSSGSEGSHMKYAPPPNTGFQGSGGTHGVQAFAAPAAAVYPSYPAGGVGEAHGDTGNV